MNIEEKYLEKIWTRINNGDDDRLMLSWDEQFDITDILKEYHAEKLALCNVVGRSEQFYCAPYSTGDKPNRCRRQCYECKTEPKQ